MISNLFSYVFRACTTATHGPSNPACQATRHTWQVAHQVAVAKGLLSAAQHRRRGRPVVLTVHNVTTVRDLQPHRAGARRRTSHGQLARNNLSKLRELNTQPGVTVTVRADAGPATASPPSASRRPGRPVGRPTLEAPSRLCVPRQRPVGRTQGLGPGGLGEGGGRREGGNTRRGLGGVEGTHDQP